MQRAHLTRPVPREGQDEGNREKEEKKKKTGQRMLECVSDSFLPSSSSSRPRTLYRFKKSFSKNV